MSYVFISPQYRVRQCPTDDGAMGFIGPDQPWTEATANKEIVPTSTPCGEDWIRVKGGETVPSYLWNPKKNRREQIMDKSDCFDTGAVIEASKPGYHRTKVYCCPPNDLLPTRVFTQPENDQYGEACQPFYKDGEEYPAEPLWIDARIGTPTGWAYRDTDIRDGGYKLICKAIRGPVEYVLDPSMIMGQARTTIGEAEAILAQKEARMAEREGIIQQDESQFQYGFFERYGIYMLAGAGILGLGVAAGLIKRSMDKKKEREAE